MIRTHSLLGFLRAGILMFPLLPLSITSFAQTEVSYKRGATQLEDILPPSPEAASKVKYSDVPFTHSMGAAEYSVPVYVMKGRRLKIPISLDYWWNTIGMKLEDVAVASSGADGSDLVTAYESDYMLHDDVRRWLPYPATGTAGSFRTEAASASSSYHGSGSAFHGRTYEESSRDKVLETTLPEYSEHPEKFSDDVVSGFPILLWKHGTVTEKGVYSIGQLVAESTQKV